jgi:DNA polymerase-1
VGDGEAIACAVAFASKGTDRIHEKIHACLKKLKTTNKPEHFIVGFDDSNNFRRKLYSEFKSDRPNDPIKEELNRLRPMVIQHLRDSGMQVEVHTGREADDVLASVAMQCQILDTECMMVTEDKDCWQSLGPKTSIYSRAKDEFYGANWLLATHKIKPTQVIDWLCMVGKNGVQGVCGIGVKTASDLLSSCGTFIDTMHSDFIPEKIRATMKQFDYWTARSLHTLDRRLPIERAFSTQSNAN